LVCLESLRVHGFEWDADCVFRIGCLRLKLCAPEMRINSS
jgi:hypothetical protein